MLLGCFWPILVPVAPMEPLRWQVSGKLTSSTSDLPVWNANWQAKSVGEGEPVNVRMRLGPWQLRGKGERTSGLRCSVVTGTVLEGDEEPVCVGR